MQRQTKTVFAGIGVAHECRKRVEANAGERRRGPNRAVRHRSRGRAKPKSTMRRVPRPSATRRSRRSSSTPGTSLRGSRNRPRLPPAPPRKAMMMVAVALLVLLDCRRAHSLGAREPRARAGQGDGTRNRADRGCGLSRWRKSPTRIWFCPALCWPTRSLRFTPAPTATLCAGTRILAARVTQRRVAGEDRHARSRSGTGPGARRTPANPGADGSGQNQRRPLGEPAQDRLRLGAGS